MAIIVIIHQIGKHFRQMAKQFESRTDARRLKLIVSAGLAAASTLLFLALIFEDIGDLADSDWSNLPIGMIVRYIVAMGLGGAIAGYALSNLFGRPGLLGWALSLIGGVIAATFAGLLGSAIGLLPDLLSDGLQSRDIVAVGAGVLVLPLALIGWPVLLPIWAGLISLVHLLATRLR